MFRFGFEGGMILERWCYGSGAGSSDEMQRITALVFRARKISMAFSVRKRKKPILKRTEMYWKEQRAYGMIKSEQVGR